MRTTKIAIVAAFVWALFPAPPSSASTTFTFHGGGFGHGLGMSQWGAYGLALKGWSHQSILTHFYSGTQVGTSSWHPFEVRVGLVDTVQTIALSAKGGPVTLRIGSWTSTGTTVGNVPNGYTWTVKVKTGQYEVVNANGQDVGGHLWGGPTQNLYASFSNGSRVYSPQAGHTYDKGHLEFNLYKGCDTCVYYERLIAVVSPQAYLDGLGEVPSTWPTESMEAQADAGRTYAFQKIQTLGQHRAGCNCALHDDTRDQVYAGYDKEVQGQGWLDAVTATVNEVVTYQGQLIQAFYMSSSGGYTENNENVFGGTAIPYLRGVCDPGDYTPANTVDTWTVGPLTAAQVTTDLAPYTGDIGTVVSFAVQQRGVSGRIMSVNVNGSTGSATVIGPVLRSALGLMDDRVWINADRSVTGPVRTLYDNLMCAPGLATTAQLAAPEGFVQRFAAGAIYLNSSTQAAHWLSGPVEDKYLAFGESGSVLGMPLTNVVKLTSPAGCSTVSCAKAKFEHGYIYFKDATGVGAHEVDGPVGAYFVSHGGAYGHLHFPVTDTQHNPDGSSQATFEGSGSPITVTCPASGPCKEST